MKKKRKMQTARLEGPVLSTRAVVFADRFYWILAGILLAVILFFCFYHLGQLPARDWDEARHGVSAYEMLKSGNWIVNTYGYQPDYYNLKPPLSFWGIMAGYKLFGFTLFGMRFYSAVAFALTAILIALFCKRRYGCLESLTVLLLLACNSPYYRFHFARHGDADALFALFSVVSLLAMLLIEEKPWALYVCSGGFSLAFLTKSWHALFIVAVVGVFLLWRKIFFRLRPLQWAGFLAAGGLPILAWAAARFQYDGTHFFAEMARTDLFNRTTQVLEGHAGSWQSYISWSFRLSLVTGLLPVVVFFLLLYLYFQFQNKVLITPHFSKDMPAVLLWFTLPVLLFSLSRTKLSWYLIPLNLPLAILTGIALALLIRGPKKEWLIRFVGFAAAALMIFLSFGRVFREIQPVFQDPLQIFLAESKVEEARGKTAYFALDANRMPDRGIQKYFLLGELYYDWIPKAGTVEAFLGDEHAEILLLEESDAKQMSDALAGCEILAQFGRFILLKK